MAYVEAFTSLMIYLNAHLHCEVLESLQLLLAGRHAAVEMVIFIQAMYITNFLSAMVEIAVPTKFCQSENWDLRFAQVSSW